MVPGTEVKPLVLLRFEMVPGTEVKPLVLLRFEMVPGTEAKPLRLLRFEMVPGTETELPKQHKMVIDSLYGSFLGIQTNTKVV